MNQNCLQNIAKSRSGSGSESKWYKREPAPERYSPAQLVDLAVTLTLLRLATARLARWRACWSSRAKWSVTPDWEQWSWAPPSSSADISSPTGGQPTSLSYGSEASLQYLIPSFHPRLKIFTKQMRINHWGVNLDTNQLFYLYLDPDQQYSTQLRPLIW